MINYVAFAMWMQRTFTMMALLYIRLSNKPVHPEAIRTPLFLPIIFLLICFSLVVVTMAENFKTSSVGLSMLAFSLLIYIFFVWDKMVSKIGCYGKCMEQINGWVTIVCKPNLDCFKDTFVWWPKSLLMVRLKLMKLLDLTNWGIVTSNHPKEAVKIGKIAKKVKFFRC